MESTWREIDAAYLAPPAEYPYLSRYGMSWFKTLKKTRKNSQHPPSSNIVSQTGAGPSSVGAGLNPTVESGGALRSTKQISSVSPLQQIQTTEILPGVIAKLRVSFGKRKGSALC